MTITPMRVEFWRDNGDKLHFNFAITDDYRIVLREISITPKGKRKPRHIEVDSEFEWRQQSDRGKAEYELDAWLKVVTMDEIKQALDLAWQNMKPKEFSTKDELIERHMYYRH